MQRVTAFISHVRAWAVAGAAAVAVSTATLSAGAGGDVGYLAVSSDPPAHVSIDEKDTGKMTPVEKLELSVGHHKLKLVTKDGTVTRTLGINIVKSETTRLNVNL